MKLKTRYIEVNDNLFYLSSIIETVLLFISKSSESDLIMSNLKFRCLTIGLLLYLMFKKFGGYFSFWGFGVFISYLTYFWYFPLQLLYAYGLLLYYDALSPHSE
jgi:hypothetical protein